MRRSFPPQLERVQALLAAQGMLRSDFVRRLRGGDVDVGVPGGALSCRETTQRERERNLNTKYSNIHHQLFAFPIYFV